MPFSSSTQSANGSPLATILANDSNATTSRISVAATAAASAATQSSPTKSTTGGLTFQPDACVRLCDLLKQWSGVKIEPSKSYLIQGRLRALMVSEKLNDLATLVDRISRPTGLNLRNQVIDMLTTHETLFFRDMHPFEVLIDRVIPGLLSDTKSTQSLEIHCAACSSGQEPYSIAMMLQEKLPANSHRRVNITATDISTGTIAQARKGEFMDHEIRRGLTPAQRKQFFEPINGPVGTPDSKLVQSIRSMVRFDVMNLTSPTNVSTVANKVDILLCRNVLIYFDDATCHEVMRSLASVVRPGGLLLLGASEMLRDKEGSFKTEIIGATRFQRRV